MSVALEERREPEGDGGISRRLVLVFALACGLTVANTYYAQPLLAIIAHSFHSSAATVGLIVTLSQIGYGLGLAFVVPLGDLVDRRRLIVAILGGTALSLVAAMVAPSLGVLLAASCAIGLTSVVAQILVPFAADLASEADRGRVVGTVMSGLLAGILLARTVAGFVAQLGGWRTMYGIGALLMLGLIAVLWRKLPRSDEERTVRLSYGTLLRSLRTLARSEPVLRRRSFYGACTFAAFGVFWTSMSFLLSRPPFGYSQAIIGLFGLAGLAGALAASFAGRLADRGLASYSTGGFLLVALLSFGLLALGARSVLLLIAGVVLLDLGVQGTHITNQSQIYRLRAEARSRLTTVYMTSYFIGGALGSATSALVFDRAGWSGVCLLGVFYLALAVLFWVTEIVAGARARERKTNFIRVLHQSTEK
jgi:predicted MFS family arabinose efflux permease